MADHIDFPETTIDILGTEFRVSFTDFNHVFVCPVREGHGVKLFGVEYAVSTHLYHYGAATYFNGYREYTRNPIDNRWMGAAASGYRLDDDGNVRLSKRITEAAAKKFNAFVGGAFARLENLAELRQQGEAARINNELHSAEQEWFKKSAELDGLTEKMVDLEDQLAAAKHEAVRLAHPNASV